MDKLKLRIGLTTIITVVLLGFNAFLTVNLDKIVINRKINVENEYELLEENEYFPTVISCDKNKYFDKDEPINIFYITKDRIFVGNKSEYEVYDYAVDDIHVYVTSPNGVKAVYVDKKKFNALDDTIIEGDFIDERSETYFSLNKDNTGSYINIKTDESFGFTYQIKEDILRLEYSDKASTHYEYMGFSQIDDYIILKSGRILTLNKVLSEKSVTGEYDFLYGDMPWEIEHISEDDYMLLSNNRFIIKTECNAHAYDYHLEDEYLTLRNGTASLIYVKMPQDENIETISHGIYASEDALTKLVFYDETSGNLTIDDKGIDFTYTLDDKRICCKTNDCNIYINYEILGDVLNISFLSSSEDEPIKYQLYKIG